MNNLPALDALTQLTDSARSARSAAATLGLQGVAVKLENIARQCDAARTRLVQDGDEYREVAWSIVDGARFLLAQHQAVIDTTWQERIYA